LNQKGEEKVKTHEQIVAMLKELESFEERLQQPELIHEPQAEYPVSEIEEALPEWTAVDGEESEPEIWKRKRIFSIRIRRKKKSTAYELEEAVEFVEVKPEGTFTLRIDDQGNLIGFNIKKPKPKKEKKQRRLLPFKKSGAKESGEEETPETLGVKGKLANIFSRRRKATEETESGEPKESDAKTKIKGLLSRRRKAKTEGE